MIQSTYLVLENRTRHKASPCFAIIGARKTKPDLNRNQTAVKVNIKLPNKFFDEVMPEAHLTVPDECLLRSDSIKVEVMNPNEET